MNVTEYLITGASGFLGKTLVNELSTENTVATLARAPHTQFAVDLSNAIPQFGNATFRTIIHASGKAHSIPKTPHEAREFFDVNVTGTMNLVKGLEKLAKLPNELVFISTVAVYGREEGENIDEYHPLNGSTPYAKSKIQTEQVLRTWCEKNQVTLTILRLPLIVGANAPGNLGAMVRMIKKGFYIGIGSGAARKSMVLAEDIARFIPRVKSIGGIYNLTDGHHPAMKELELTITQQVRKRSPFRLPDTVVRMMAKVGDLLGDKAPINTAKFNKLTASLTFSDERAKAIGWSPRSVIKNLPQC
jgi:nucleoside-diphosphate-sugar epimerase